MLVKVRIDHTNGHVYCMIAVNNNVYTVLYSRTIIISHN